MQPSYDYQQVLTNSERVNWRVEDIIGGSKRLDFDRPFMPESLARVRPLSFLSPSEQLVMNQIRGRGYLYLFGVVEEFIVPFVLDHARSRLNGDDARTRALLHFADEEAKHIQLFNRFREEFDAGFGTPCEGIGPADAIAGAVLSHGPLAVALVILHIEWLTQTHFLESVRDDQTLDPQFKSLLKNHWLEEAQHAQLDTLMVEALVEAADEEEIVTALDEYEAILRFIDGGLAQQLDLDAESLVRATGRELSAEEREHFVRVQQAATRWTFIGSGLDHELFLGTMDRVHPSAKARIGRMRDVYC
jgi:hypothetical protein